MKYLCQRDPAWCNDKLGKSSLTLGRFGCTTCCVSMVSDYFRHYISPIELAHNVNNYTKDGLIIWKNLPLKGFKFDWRDYEENPAKISVYLKDPDKAVILQVNNGAHWVVALSKVWFKDDYVILDPWTGKKTTAKGAYKNITGAAYFSLT